MTLYTLDTSKSGWITLREMTTQVCVCEGEGGGEREGECNAEKGISRRV